MKRYDEYKDSGVEWIGEVPRHWEVVPLKRAITINNGCDYKHVQVEEDGYPVIGSGGQFAWASQYMYDGEAVLLGRKGTIDKPMYYNGKFWTVDTMFYGIPKKNANCKYLYYIAKNIPFERYATATALPSMTQTDLNNNTICLPPLDEQSSIANYLDKKCSEIDKVISAQQKRIALLQELKQSVITHAVTKGLNPNVEMKDSGVEWIGKIPASWDVVHLKRILRERMQYGANEPAESDDTTYPRYIRITDITANGELRPETFKSLEPSKAKDYLLDKGDVLFARSGATVGKTFLFNADIKACYAGYLIKASCDKRRMLPEYLYYYTQSGAYECWKNSVFIQSTIQNIGADKYQMMYIPVPSKDEQKQIVEYTMRKSQIFDAAISKAQHQVELLQEYKQSLITEVVTGKRKVS